MKAFLRELLQRLAMPAGILIGAVAVMLLLGWW